MIRASLAALTLTLATLALPALGDEVNVYSHRQPELIQPLVDAFTAETGIAVNVAFVDKGMAERLVAEGARSPADLVLTVDIARLMQVVQADVIQPVQSPVLEANIPASRPRKALPVTNAAVAAAKAAMSILPSSPISITASVASSGWAPRKSSMLLPSLSSKPSMAGLLAMPTNTTARCRRSSSKPPKLCGGRMVWTRWSRLMPSPFAKACLPSI